MAIPNFVKAYLDEHIVPYDIIHHQRDFTAQETAAHTHTPGSAFAKTVILEADSRYVMAVIPAHQKLDLQKVKKAIAATEIRLAEEAEIKKLCPDCEVGAMPPFGALYKMPVIACPEITKNNLITFNAGTHEDAIRIQYSDFSKLAQPKVAEITKQVS